MSAARRLRYIALPRITDPEPIPRNPQFLPASARVSREASPFRNEFGQRKAPLSYASRAARGVQLRRWLNRNAKFNSVHTTTIPLGLGALVLGVLTKVTSLFSRTPYNSAAECMAYLLSSDAGERLPRAFRSTTKVLALRLSEYPLWTGVSGVAASRKSASYSTSCTPPQAAL